MLELQLAWRNLWRHPRRTWLTVGAMVFANVLLIFLIGLQLGMYQLMIDNSLRVFTGHAQVQAPGYQEEPGIRKTVSAIEGLSADLRENISAAQFSARAAGFALASSEDRSYGIQIVGIQPASEATVSALPGLVVRGRYLQPGDEDSVVIGSILARNLRVGVGDELTLLGSGLDGSMAADVLQVVGIFESGMPVIDRALAQMPLDRFQGTFSLAGAGHSIVMKLSDFSRVDTTIARLESVLDERENLRVVGWRELQPGLEQAIQADMASAWFMYGILIILVAFSVLNTQLMSVLERTREFGIVMALGLRAGRMVRLILLETALMAGLGLIIGVLLGTALNLVLGVTGFYYPGLEQMAERFNLPDRMYPELSLTAALLGPSIIFLASILAALYPAFRLHFLQPVAAMRAT